MSTLWITGDSFSHISESDINPLIWSVQLSHKLKYNLENCSLWGISQDWEFNVINNLFKSKISIDDQLIVVLTDQSRYWFFEDMPGLTNIYTVDFRSIIGEEKADTVASYIRHIHRKSLDIQHTSYRLGWLNNLATMNNWKKPIILLGFPCDILDVNEYPNLIFSTGNLNEQISKLELKSHLRTQDAHFKLLKGSDPRYNHMCLRNHTVLSTKLYNTIVGNEVLDLTLGFEQNLLDEWSIYNPTFAKSNFSEESYIKFMALAKILPTQPLSFFESIFHNF